MIRLWNRAAETMFGHGAAEAIGQTLDLIVPEPYRVAHWAGFSRAVTQRCFAKDDVLLTSRALTKDGRMTVPAVSLMQPTLVAKPFHHKGWVYEEKVDGYRMVAHKDDGAVSIISRQGKDCTSGFPDLVKALAAVPARSFTLDGEVAVYDQAHIPRFEWLRARPKDGRATLPVYMVFDVLELDGKDWRPEPLWKRRRVLEELVAPERMILPVRRLSSDGLKAWAQAIHKGYEGLVGKIRNRPTLAGAR